MSKIKWQVRWSPTLGDLESTHQKVWGTDEYTDQERPTCFFGIYGLPDFYALWRHRGERHILWAGSDLTNFSNGYWLEDGGGIRLDRKALAEWINKHCTNWCENEVEARKLAECGIFAKVQPSFLGDINDFPLSFKPGNKVYASVSGDNFELYGWDTIQRIAPLCPEVSFHLYGNTVAWDPKADNIVVHGRVPKERMNAEIADMQCGFRPLEFDGASEVLVKNILQGGYPISRISYPHVSSYRNDEELVSLLGQLKYKENPNLEARNWWRANLNLFPWNSNVNKL